MVTDEDIFSAYYLCLKHKGSSPSTINYMLDHRQDLIRLADEINSREYHPSTSITFVVTRPKYREVFAANFRDRVVHHLIAMRIEPLFEEIFGDRTFNCRKEKGVLYGINMLRDDIAKCSENYTRSCYVMRLDLKGFFMSIDKQLLDGMLREFITRYYFGHDKDDILWLTHVIVMHRPELNCEFRSAPEKWDHLPPNKSLFTNGDGLGLPIGNLSSQLFANFLLNLLDWYLERNLGFPFHGRYVDDFYVIDRSKRRLLRAVPKIRQMLLERCHVQLHQDKFYIQHYSKGIKFTGAVVKFGRIYPAKRTIGNFISSVYRFNQAQSIDEIKHGLQSINSYLGILRHMNSYALRRRILSMIDDRLWQYVYVKGHHEVLCLKSRYKKNPVPWRDSGLQVYYMKDPINWDLLDEDNHLL